MNQRKQKEEGKEGKKEDKTEENGRIPCWSRALVACAVQLALGPPFIP